MRGPDQRRAADAHDYGDLHRGRLYFPQHASEAVTPTSPSTFRRFGKARSRRSGPKRSPSIRQTARRCPRTWERRSRYVRKLLDALRIPILEYPGFEADDVIGTIARRAEESGEVDVVIVSSDKDMLQLVTDRVSMLNPMKDDIGTTRPKPRNSWECRRVGRRPAGA